MNKNKREGRDKMKKIFSLFLAFSLIITSLLVNPNVINYVYADEKPTLLTADFSTGNQNKIPNGVTVTPEFSSQVTEYTVTINPPLRSAVVRTGISLTLQAAENCKIKEVKQQEKLLNVKNGECTIKGLSAGRRSRSWRRWRQRFGCRGAAAWRQPSWPGPSCRQWQPCASSPCRCRHWPDAGPAGRGTA